MNDVNQEGRAVWLSLLCLSEIAQVSGAIKNINFSRSVKKSVAWLLRPARQFDLKTLAWEYKEHSWRSGYKELSWRSGLATDEDSC